jgi:regulator of CtrA degradation
MDGMSQLRERWQVPPMDHAPLALNRKLIDSLYVEAMVLADEARSYFDANGRAERDALPAMQRVGFSCESLRVTTRLMHVIAWLLTQRAVFAGEIGAEQAIAPERRLGRAQSNDPEIVPSLPETARQIIAATSDLYARVARLDVGMNRRAPIASPAQSLMRRLEMAF